ncbi:MAG: PmoA family protein [Phycisphaerae bacterium]|nr:PmoA family protein [Phycisphaerae bacterium]
MTYPQPKLSQLVVLTAAVVVLCAAADLAWAAEVTITKCDGKAVVKIDGDLFTEYVLEGHSKPILYPVIGPTGVGMTRNYPMKEDVDNEARDHPHQKSIWFTHDDVNGFHFWLEYPHKGSDLKPGRIVQKAMEIEGNAIRTENDWLDPDGKAICSDTRRLVFGVTPSGRYIDYAVTLRASHGDVVFGDTKEGTMGIRTHPLLRLQADEKRGNHTAKGNCVNSEGTEGKAIWGQRAKWVDYWAPIEGETVGIAIFDHPTNPRHPTWWHARYYGLVAANPFGIHDFEKKPEGTGDMKIASGQSITLRYRFLFHRGDVREANIAGEYEAFAKAD